MGSCMHMCQNYERHVSCMTHPLSGDLDRSPVPPYSPYTSLYRNSSGLPTLIHFVLPLNTATRMVRRREDEVGASIRGDVICWSALNATPPFPLPTRKQHPPRYLSIPSAPPWKMAECYNSNTRNKPRHGPLSHASALVLMSRVTRSIVTCSLSVPSTFPAATPGLASNGVDFATPAVLLLLLP